jgi:hypothetical protein
VEQDERLARFLEWRRATGRKTRSGRGRWGLVAAGTAVLGGTALALVVVGPPRLPAMPALPRLSPPAEVRSFVASLATRLPILLTTLQDRVASRGAARGERRPAGVEPRSLEEPGPTELVASSPEVASAPEVAGSPAQPATAEPQTVQTPRAPTAGRTPPPALSLPERRADERDKDLWGSGTAGEILATLERSPTPPRRAVREELREKPGLVPQDEVTAATPAPEPPPTATVIPAPPPAPADVSRWGTPAPVPADVSRSAPPSAPAEVTTSGPPASAPADVSRPALPLSAPAPAAAPLGARRGTPAPAEPRVAAAPVRIPSRPVGPMPEVAVKPLPAPLETLKRLVDYVPEVKVGKMIVRWIKAQPRPDEQPPPAPPQRSPQQAR